MKYTHRISKRAKHLNIRVEPTLKVVVTSPPNIKKQKVEEFVQSKKTWIQARKTKIKALKNKIETENHLMIFGYNYQKLKLFNAQYEPGIYLKKKQIIFNFPFINQKHNQKTIEQEKVNFLITTARHYFRAKIDQLSAEMKVSYLHLKIRNQKTRWGSCSSKNNINLNWRLVHYPTEIINYVLIHELAHLKHHNHSQKFWHYVAEFDQNYQQHRHYLKEQALTLV